MKCPSCQADVAVTARFCPNCSHPIIKEQDIKYSSEVSTQWLKEILEAQEYKVEANEKDPNILFALHDRSPNLFITLLPNINLISFETLFKINKVGWGKKTQFLTALNNANSSHRTCTFYTTDTMDSVSVSTFMYLTEKISNRDIFALIDLFSEGIYRTFEASGLKEFA